MATLQLKFEDIVQEVAAFLGLSLSNSRNRERIESYVRSGLRQFYFPPPDANNGSPWSWSFLQPVAELPLKQGATTIRLPEDFGGIEGIITVFTSQQTGWPMQTTNAADVEFALARQPLQTGRPLMVCEEPLKGTEITHGQRFQLKFFPIADQDYTIRMAYYILPECLTGNHPYAYGGAEHSETILQSCLDVAESRGDDTEGVHRKKFFERLRASIAIDAKKKPQNLGPNLDRSVQRTYNRGNYRGWGIDFPRITYNGNPLD